MGFLQISAQSGSNFLFRIIVLDVSSSLPWISNLARHDCTQNSNLDLIRLPVPETVNSFDFGCIAR